MARERKNNMIISNSNRHLLDVFSDDLYLELGSINYDPLNNLLNRKLVDFKDLSSFEIINKGLGAMKCDSDELSYKLPFLKLANLVEKNKSYQLVLTYGLLLRRNGYKEHFSPIILIPVRLYFENNTILFQMINKPIVNQHIRLESSKLKENNDKLDSIQNMDRFIMNYLNNHTHNVRSESFLTVMSVSQPEINVRHDKFKVNTSVASKLIDTYSTSLNETYYNITSLDRQQRNILAMASQGNSFGIIGQEGTGKTTTLINIAADAIKRGKRVLYVSNNDSTLDYVFDVFENSTLGRFVSKFNQSYNKINEKNFEIRKGQVLESVLKNELKQKYDIIDRVGSSFADKTKNYLLIEVMKELILTQKPSDIFDEKIMKNAYNLYKHEINEVLDALEIIEKEMKKMPSFINSHFINIPITHNIKDYRDPLKVIEKIYLNYCILKEEKDILEKKYGFSKITDYALFINKIKDYGKINKTIIPLPWYEITNNIEEINEKFGHFVNAQNLFAQIEEEVKQYDEIEKIIAENYDFGNSEFEVKKAIKTITDKYFSVKNNNVNIVLEDYKLLDEDINKALEYCNELESNFAKLKSRLGFTIDLSNSKVITEILDFVYVLDTGYFSKVWCDYDNSEGIYRKMYTIENTLDKYGECMKVYNKYFDNLGTIEVYIKMLEKKNKDASNKYKKVLVRELLDSLYFIRANMLKVDQMKKDYKELTYSEYTPKVHISEIYKEFIDKHNAISDESSRKQIEKSFQDLRGSGIIDLLSLAKEYRKTVLNVNLFYDKFAHYTLIKDAKTIVEKVAQIRSIKKYIKNVVSTQNAIQQILKNHSEKILYEDYIELQSRLNTRSVLKDRISKNEQYKYLYGDLFCQEKTNPQQLKLVIEDFKSYVNIFKDPNCLIKSFEPKFNGQISIHLESAEKIIKEIGDLFQVYVKMFKTNISKFYYDDFKKIASYFHTLLESKEELRTYLAISDQMKVLLKYKLFNLNNFIIYNNHELVKNRFKYSYFLHLYNEYKEKNPQFNKNTNHEELMESILFLEKDLIDNNIEVVRLSNKTFRSGKSSHLNYNQFIERNKNNKMLFLCDTQIANTFLNMDLFDLAIIDDAQLLNANVYYKAIAVEQVIISGSEQMETSVNNNLMSRMRKTNFVKLRYKYKKTPLNLLLQYEDLTGRFYSDIEDNKGVIVTNEDFNSIVLDLYKEDPNCKINFYTTSLSIMHEMIKNVGSVLFDKELSVFDIYSFFKYNLNVSDLTVGYSLDTDYNILHLDSYADVNNDAIATNMINILKNCGKKLIIIDPKNLLKSEKPSIFIEKLNDVINFQLPKYMIYENTVIERVSKSLAKYQIKTKLISSPIHLVVEYENKYYGIILFENPEKTEFTLLNEYREFKSYDFPIVVVWLSNLTDDYAKAINEIVKDIRS